MTIYLQESSLSSISSNTAASTTSLASIVTNTGTANTNLTTINTTLGTLTTINSSIATGNASLATIAGNGTSNGTSLSTIATNTSGIATTNTTLTSINTSVQALSKPTDTQLIGRGDSNTFSSVQTLTTTGPGTAVSVNKGRCYAVQFTVTSIGSTVVVQAEGSMDGTNYFNLAADNSQYSVTSNGTYCLTSIGIPLAYIRLNVISLGTGSPSIGAVIGYSS